MVDVPREMRFPRANNPAYYTTKVQQGDSWALLIRHVAYYIIRGKCIMNVITSGRGKEKAKER